mmetsp:Transcript_115182/g.211837  ORF Transcript_115182/g.211837 Transcript_115182/m.211837 type:complete len:136 (+) Transcript_115182:148-555(+)
MRDCDSAARAGCHQAPMDPATNTPRGVARTLLLTLVERQSDAREKRLIHGHIIDMERMTAEWAGDVWLLMTQLSKHGLQQATLAKCMTTDGSHRLPEWIPADWTCEVSKGWVIYMLTELSKKLLRGFQPANTQCG